MGNAPAIFYDRRELFCPRILSFRSDFRWVRAHFLGKPQKGLPKEKENSHQQGFATSKAHKRETQGKHFDLFHIESFLPDTINIKRKDAEALRF